MCTLLTASTSLSKEWQDLISLPITCAVLFQSASSMLLIVGVLIDTYSMLIPFILNCIVHIVLCVGGMCWVVLASSKLPSEAVPLALITCVAVIIIYMWFAVIICMTFILIRDKKRLG
ncbi:hypothetical protein WR25_22429 isoform D [Diploscapter pachys]|uniref:Uncharacterized protein n=1 Tax=Diploscapter pachys TaxID=2018661 RepID=A0A2A2LU41_9BILA|nr:hypothetical protein WR25_22429 isoform A [Diploscapter pachys]PAV89773.1 hypothetical protein WR25_22429 isoform B [Diploscapter pachys]PAV89774.1 hypothetical protein WR25_22429 isoform C [Diploscapter pachys]PAV89775.1 hypothetical protein WR25_22429 isoform D [Diploscapter pachys]